VLSKRTFGLLIAAALVVVTLAALGVFLADNPMDLSLEDIDTTRDPVRILCRAAPGATLTCSVSCDETPHQELKTSADNTGRAVFLLRSLRGARKYDIELSCQSQKLSLPLHVPSLELTAQPTITLGLGWIEVEVRLNRAMAFLATAELIIRDKSRSQTITTSAKFHHRLIFNELAHDVSFHPQLHLRIDGDGHRLFERTTTIEHGNALPSLPPRTDTESWRYCFKHGLTLFDGKFLVTDSERRLRWSSRPPSPLGKPPNLADFSHIELPLEPEFHLCCDTPWDKSVLVTQSGSPPRLLFIPFDSFGAHSKAPASRSIPLPYPPGFDGEACQCARGCLDGDTLFLPIRCGEQFILVRVDLRRGESTHSTILSGRRHTPPTVCDDVVFLALSPPKGRDTRYALNHHSLKLQWQVKTKGRIQQAPRVSDGWLWLCDGDYIYRLQPRQRSSGPLLIDESCGERAIAAPGATHAPVYYKGRGWTLLRSKQKQIMHEVAVPQLASFDWREPESSATLHDFLPFHFARPHRVTDCGVIALRKGNLYSFFGDQLYALNLDNLRVTAMLQLPSQPRDHFLLDNTVCITTKREAYWVPLWPSE